MPELSEVRGAAVGALAILALFMDSPMFHMLSRFPCFVSLLRGLPRSDDSISSSIPLLANLLKFIACCLHCSREDIVDTSADIMHCHRER